MRRWRLASSVSEPGALHRERCRDDGGAGMTTHRGCPRGARRLTDIVEVGGLRHDAYCACALFARSRVNFPRRAGPLTSALVASCTIKRRAHMCGAQYQVVPAVAVESAKRRGVLRSHRGLK
jgi:hypothetical protein